MITPAAIQAREYRREGRAALAEALMKRIAAVQQRQQQQQAGELFEDGAGV